MSSGSILLQQLRSRQSKTSSIDKKSSTDGKNENTSIITTTRHGTASAPTCNQSVAAVSQRTISKFATTKKKQIIEVCLGPDCAVAGGGAALLEIEDLVRQQQQCPNKHNDDDDDDDTKIVVQAGGCRDHCTEGPNVRILSSYGGGGVDCDFHKVNCPEACRRVVSSVCPREDLTINNEFLADRSKNVAATINNKSSSSDDVVAGLLLRKEDAKRWKAHRERAAKERRLQAIARNEGS